MLKALHVGKLDVFFSVGAWGILGFLMGCENSRIYRELNCGLCKII